MKEEMSTESFLLVSLKEDESKKLAQVLSNDTSRKILDYLSGKTHATETDLSKKLDLPLSTVHYNLTHLVKSRLVNDDHFTYSKKGKEIIHYSLSNKYVIIAPSATESLKEKLMKILPVFLIIAAVSVALNFINNITLKAKSVFNAEMVQTARDGFAEEPVKAARVPAAWATPAYLNIALWFFIGAVCALVIYAVVNYFYKKRK
ncbi:helix-turn-helix domain-containing protein [Candidatus Woesearchaeota archaeon]|nr:helix-turn-helix domain-containing protein [Candidatus Woesearchaeota archaeon]